MTPVPGSFSDAKSAGQTRRGQIVSRIVMGLLVFAVVSLLSLLVPPAIPGELSFGEMTKHTAEPCQSCPPTEQIVAAGLMAGEDKWYLNVRFAQVPFNSSLRISFAGVPGTIDVQQTGTTWHTLRTSQAGAPAIASVVQHGNQVVFGFPVAIRANGVAVSTSSGDRLPSSGFVEPVLPAASRFNLADAVLVMLLALGAWYGFRRGLAVELAGLLVSIVSVALSVAIVRPLSGRLAQLTGSPQSAALLLGALMVIIMGSIGVLLMPKLLAVIQTGVQSMDLGLSRFSGTTAAVVRYCVVLAMMLTVGVNGSFLGWASRSIHSSIFAGALIHAWRSLLA